MINGIIFDFNRTLYDPENDRMTEGAIPLLENLSDLGYKLCLLSKKTSPKRRELISQLGLDKYFMDIQVVEGSKTEVRLQQCADAMSLFPKNIIFVSDRAQTDIPLGNKFGIRTVWYKSGKFANDLPRQESEKPNIIISKLDQVLKYVIDSKV